MFVVLLVSDRSSSGVKQARGRAVVHYGDIEGKLVEQREGVGR